jgi:two-component system phosphate regulon sensor histidine kinase PhoR
MRQEDPDIDYIRIAATALPFLLAILTLSAVGRVDRIAMVVLWGTAAISLLWLLARYRADILRERRRLRIGAGGRERGGAAPLALVRIVDGMADPLLLLDMKRRVLHANRAARTLVGEAIVGKDISFYVRHPAALEALDAAIASGQPAEREFTLLDPVERACMMRAGIIEAGEEDATARFVLASILDLTKMKRVEKMRADFVANASHELRTPLATIAGFIETLAGPAANDAEARRRFLAIMGEEAARMLRLIEDLLSLSRIELDEHLPPGGAVDLAPLLENIVNTMAPRGKKDAPEIRLSLAAALPPARADRDQLVQVFQNLIDNAIKYGRAGTPVDITAQPVERIPGRSEGGVAVTVFNQGEAIPPEHIPRLTERFYRVDSARSRKLGGTGLGLAIVKHIVSRHRGALAIDSVSGLGTTVTVYLPSIAAAPAA